MRSLAPLVLVALAGCPPPNGPAVDGPVDDDPYAGQGETWAWGKRVCSLTSTGSTGQGLHYWRNAEGRVAAVDRQLATGQGSNLERRGYGRDGRLAIVERDGVVDRYHYDAAGRLARIVDSSDGTAITFVRDAAGRIIERRATNGFVQRWTRDVLGRVVAYFAGDETTGAVTSNATWTYDGQGRAATGVVQGTDGTGPVYFTLVFTWDGDRLVDLHDRSTNWDHHTYYVWDERGRLVETSQQQEGYPVGSVVLLDHTDDGIREMRGIDPAWRITFVRDGGLVIRTQELDQRVDQLVDNCPASVPARPIAALDSYYDPTWPMPYLPYEPLDEAQ